jgi:hypothetical protein
MGESELDESTQASAEELLDSNNSGEKDLEEENPFEIA